MGDINGMQLAFDFLDPEIQKPFELREMRGTVVILPDEFLQQFRVIGQVVKNLRRRQAVMIGKLLFKVCHPFQDSIVLLMVC